MDREPGESGTTPDDAITRKTAPDRLGMSVAMGIVFGMIGGVALGLVLFDNVGLGIGIGIALGAGLGATGAFARFAE